MREQEGHRTDVFIGPRAFSLVKWEGAVPGPPAGGFPTTAGHHSKTSPFAVDGPHDALPTNETRDLAFPIHRWNTTQSRLWQDGRAIYESTFITIQSARGQNSSEKRTQRWQERAQQITQNGQA
ncbi:hypothetical protein [Micrococcus sp. HMSC067E09]|uniref:hypothetical protein n=1 Tax=Micrococcus sp. HMSC067E09 TaxID=1739367 RepID=UPI00114D2566|nr:hypothetical protein [Micrococcus sp. HMSC067E09]